MYILGAGYAYPETVLSNPFLAELSDEFAASLITDMTGIKSRYSVLNPLYLRETKNTETKLALENSLESPTDLAVRAAKMALSSAGVAPERLGLILGDCSTPVETIPAEAHRVAKRFSLKIPSYDLFSSSATLSLALSTLSSWKDERIPDYVLFVSTSTPTQKINYKSGIERLYFGDAASALIISPRFEGKLKVQSTFYGTDAKAIDLLTFELFGHARLSSKMKDVVVSADRMMIERAQSESKLDLSSLKWVGAQFDSDTLRETGQRAGFGVDNTWYNVDRCGSSLGATSGCVLAEKWDRIEPGSKILCTQAGAGFSFGYSLFEARGI